MQTTPDWPVWATRLPADSTGTRRAEGGKRLQQQATGGVRQSRPLISYITVVRNAERTIARTLQSVQAQRGPAVEHILLDGLSTDGTLALIEAHAEQIDYYASEADGGLYEALNKAIPLARGELICILNADDWLSADAAQSVARAYEKAGQPDAVLMLSAAWALKRKGSGLSRRLWLPTALDMAAYLRCANICHNGVYATRSAYARTGPYATNLPVAADFKWLMRSVDAGVPTLNVDKPTVHYAPGGLSSNLQQHTLDCATVLADRFPFLSSDEVWGLMNAFHRFRGNMLPFADRRPADTQTFLKALAKRHAAHPDLLATLALAQTGAEQTWAYKLSRGWRKLRVYLPFYLRGGQTARGLEGEP